MKEEGLLQSLQCDYKEVEFPPPCGSVLTYKAILAVLRRCCLSYYPNQYSEWRKIAHWLISDHVF